MEFSVRIYSSGADSNQFTAESIKLKASEHVLQCANEKYGLLPTFDNHNFTSIFDHQA
jgi:hypothetical protein